MKRDYKLTEAAKKDLRKISAYTTKTWGKEQEKIYREIIRTALKNIDKSDQRQFYFSFAKVRFIREAIRVGIINVADHKSPEIGQKREKLAEDLRSSPVGNHIAHYIKKNNQIIFVRIMDSSTRHTTGAYQAICRWI